MGAYSLAKGAGRRYYQGIFSNRGHGLLCYWTRLYWKLKKLLIHLFIWLLYPNYSYHSRSQLTQWRLWRDPELVTIFKLQIYNILCWYMQINKDGFFPADILFLSSTNPDGICYVEVLVYFGYVYWLYLWIYILNSSLVVVHTFCECRLQT